ncbi:NUDIX domain-containing protein [uncultured Jatrophihabitans sp.]|uniref:NUDIX hydrolase n=1 Tax=uncultured Jatrophihabitans sp. TaxID=1610747 RepID=UPI0035CB1A4C
MPDKRSSGSTIRAAGGAVWRMRDGVVHVALVHRPRYDDWSLPKGKLEPGESELDAAVREIGEELGSRVAASRRLTTISYDVDGQHKTVSYWTMRHLTGQFVASDEVDEVAWLPVAEASERCRHDGDREVLNDFATTPPPDSVIVLVRHAKAGKRSEWSGPDVKRPLDAAGRRQARALARFLRCFAPDRVLSANPLRCVQTVGPFANDAALDVVVEPAFGDEAYERDPAAAENALLALAKPRRVSVVCSQGATIPGLVPAVAPYVRSAETKKAAAWVLSFVDGVAVAADYCSQAGR